MVDRVEKVSFRELKEGDEEWLVEVNMKEIREYLLVPSVEKGNLSLKDEREWIRKKLKEKKNRNVVILYKNEPAGIGEVRLEENVAEIGLWIRKKFWGKGLCKELIKKLLEIAREKKYNKVILEVDENNIRGRRCYEAVGFEYCGFEERALKYMGRWRDILRMEYIFNFKESREKEKAKVEIRKYKDVDKAFEIHKNSNSIYDAFYKPSRKEVEKLEGDMYFAYLSKKAVGFMSLIEKEREMEIEWLEVHKDYQKKVYEIAWWNMHIVLLKEKIKSF